MRIANAPKASDEGVSFTVEVGFSNRECLISRNALSRLSRTKTGQSDLMAVYLACEDEIHTVARRLAVAGVSGSPLVIGASNFS